MFVFQPLGQALCDSEGEKGVGGWRVERRVVDEGGGGGGNLSFQQSTVGNMTFTRHGDRIRTARATGVIVSFGTI